MKAPEKNLLEWIVFGVAMVLVLATFGYLVREALTETRGPADIVVTLGEARPGSGGHMVPLKAENRGSETAEEVRVTIVLDLGQAREEAVLVFPYLPRGSSRDGWVGFQSDPRRGRLRVAGIAYQAP
jgi:uncharacterized protein (TIGR02588 family)